MSCVDKAISEVPAIAVLLKYSTIHTCSCLDRGCHEHEREQAYELPAWSYLVPGWYEPTSGRTGDMYVYLPLGSPVFRRLKTTRRREINSDPFNSTHIRPPPAVARPQVPCCTGSPRLSPCGAHASCYSCLLLCCFTLEVYQV